LAFASHTLYLAALFVFAWGWVDRTARAQDVSDSINSDSSIEQTSAIELAALVDAAERQRIDAIARAMPSATSIFVPGGGGGGSGVVISPDGFALTNFHVTSPAGTYMQCSLADGNLYDAVIVGIDPVGDLAMVQLLGRNDFAPVEIGSSLQAKPGDWSFVIGNPFLLAGDLQPTVTWGILSGVSRYQYPSGTLLEYGDCLQTDASINPGNSGGPIYDAQGSLLGIVGRCSFEKRGRVNVGVGYAISINQAMNFAGSLRVGRIVDHATLGATVATDPDGGVRVTNILEYSDAFRRGLRYDSEILSIDGRAVTTANEMQNVLATFPASWRVPIVFRQDDKRIETLVRLQSVHSPDDLLEQMAGAMPPPPPIEEDPKKKSSEGDEESEDSPNNEQDSDDEDAPRDPHSPNVEAVEIPEAVERLYIEKRGFANYHFNKLEQTQFIQSLRANDRAKPLVNKPESSVGKPESSVEKPESSAGKPESSVGKPESSVGKIDAEKQSLLWKISGKTADGQDVRIQIGDSQSLLSIGTSADRIGNRAEAYDAVSKSQPLAIAAALGSLRRMIQLGPDRFGETYAAGTAPLGGARPLRNVVVATDGEMEVHFLTHPDDRRLEAIEVFADRDSDPAELWFETAAVNETPQSIELKFGVESKLRIQIESWTVESAQEAKPNDQSQPGNEVKSEKQAEAAS
jgi:serine protease Do